MTRKEAKRLAELYSALAEGKIIQFNQENGEWIDLKTESIRAFPESAFRYRIKPEPKFRPFKNQEECWNEMLKHKPLGWLRNTYTKRLHNIDSIGHTTYGITLDNNCITDFDVAFDAYNFVDGTPFGIKED